MTRFARIDAPTPEELCTLANEIAYCAAVLSSLATGTNNICIGITSRTEWRWTRQPGGWRVESVVVP